MKIKKHRIKFIICGFLLLLSTSIGFAQGSIQAVIPQELTNAEGNGNGLFFANVPHKFQFIYQASEFTSILPLGGTINGISFRLDGPAGYPHTGSVPSDTLHVDFPLIEFRMSTTLVYPLKLMHPEYADFQENVGSDSIVVFPPQSLVWNATWTRGEVQSFELTVPFDKPFFYDPQKGHLLIEMFNYNAANSSGRLYLDTSSRIIGKAVGGGISDQFGAVSSPLPVIQLDVLPVPEPSVALWASLPLFALFLLGARNRQ
jgi:hypothetical protein